MRDILTSADPAKAEITLYGAVGLDWWSDDYFTAMDVIGALARIGRATPVAVRLNSPGGDAQEGVAIFNALDSHLGEVTLFVDGCAYSAGSLIAMAAKKIIMRPGATMMIHDPAGITIGTQADHEKSIEMLNAIGSAMAEIYADRCGRPVDEVRGEMKSEIWMTAAQAIEKGYADEEDDDEELDPNDPEENDEGEDDPATGPLAFNYRLYAHAPQQLTALSDEKGWSAIKDKPKRTSRARARGPKEKRPAAVAPLDPVVKPGVEGNQQQGNQPMTEAEANARATEIINLCVAEGSPALAAGFIGSGKSIDAVRTELASAKQIRQVVSDARKNFPALDERLADQYIAGGKSVDAARADLFDRISAIQNAGGGDIRSSHGSLPASANDASVLPKSIDKVNARLKNNPLARASGNIAPASEV